MCFFQACISIHHTFTLPHTNGNYFLCKNYRKKHFYISLKHLRFIFTIIISNTENSEKNYFLWNDTHDFYHRESSQVFDENYFKNRANCTSFIKLKYFPLRVSLPRWIDQRESKFANLFFRGVEVSVCRWISTDDGRIRKFVARVHWFAVSIDLYRGSLSQGKDGSRVAFIRGFNLDSARYIGYRVIDCCALEEGKENPVREFCHIMPSHSR